MKVFVFESVTGGGLAGRELPGSWAAEGGAMRRAIVEDFAAVPGVRVVTTVDARLSLEAPPGVDVLPIPGGKAPDLVTLASEADYTLLVAPETDGILARLARRVECSGGRSLGSSPRAIGWAGNKARVGRFLFEREIPTPPTLGIGRSLFERPSEWAGPIVVKPKRGAGSVDTVVARDGRLPAWVPRDGSFVAQPYRPGESMSAGFLVDGEGGTTLLAVGRQRIEVDDSGKISYRGGTLLPRVGEVPSAVDRAMEAILGGRGRGLRGFVGVDYLLGDRGEATVLEINPRPTTSYVGLTRLFPLGLVAGAWLAGHARGLLGTDWPGRLRVARDAASPVTFDADGTIPPDS